MIIVFMVFGVAAFLLLERWVYQKFWEKDLQVTLRFENPAIYEREQGILEEVVENHKRLPLPVLKIKFQCSKYLRFDRGINSTVTDFYYRNDVFTAMPMKRITRRLTFTGAKRGYYGIRGIDLLSTDLFYLKNLRAERQGETYLYVLPRPFSGGDFDMVLQKISGETLARRALLEDPFENRGIRPYQPYDAMRTINWKATARTGMLQVNQKNYTALKGVRIFLNLDDHAILRQEELLEYAIRMAAMLAQQMLGLGIRVSLFANAPDTITGNYLEIPAGAGAGQLDTIRKGLARIDLEKPAYDYSEFMLPKMLDNPGETCTAVISPNHYKDFQESLVRYQKQDPDFFWLCPVYRSMDSDKQEVLDPLKKCYQPVVCERE